MNVPATPSFICIAGAQLRELMHINNADASAAIHEVRATCTRPVHAALALAEPKAIF